LDTDIETHAAAKGIQAFLRQETPEWDCLLVNRGLHGNCCHTG